MSRSLNIVKFGGIAPRFGDKVPVGLATVAENVDLAGNSLALLPLSRRTIPTPLYSPTALSWPIGSLTVGLSLVGGVLKKTVGGITVDAGQDAPAIPAVALDGAGNITGDVAYVVTTTRNVGGHLDESGPSSPSTILSASSNKVAVTKPIGIDPYVTHWNIYRIGTAAEYLLVASVPIATGSYSDDIEEADLGIAIPTFYTSRQDNSILFAKPGQMDGISSSVYHGMVFGFRGSTLFWNDPMLPDAWIPFYNMNWHSVIKRVIPFAGSVGVLTEAGPFKIDGSNPELLNPSDVLGKEPCAGTAAYPWSKGILYLSDSGIVNFNLMETEVITDALFGEEWFSGNVDPATADIVENDGFIYLSNPNINLMGDFRSGAKPQWVTVDPGKDTFTWRSGDFALSTNFGAVSLEGSGDVTLSVFLNGSQIASRLMHLSSDMERHKRLPLDPNTTDYAIQIQIEGVEGSVVKALNVEHR